MKYEDLFASTSSSSAHSNDFSYNHDQHDSSSSATMYPYYDSVPQHQQLHYYYYEPPPPPEDTSSSLSSASSFAAQIFRWLTSSAASSPQQSAQEALSVIATIENATDPAAAQDAATDWISTMITFAPNATAAAEAAGEAAAAATDKNLRDGEVLRNLFMVYGSWLLIIWCFFCWARLHFPKPFTVRHWTTNPELKSPLAAEQYGYFSWIWMLQTAITEDEILEHCGLDALCFLRALTMGKKLCMVGVFNAIWLMPLYHTAAPMTSTTTISTPKTSSSSSAHGHTNTTTLVSITDRIVGITVSNVPKESYRFIGTVLACYILIFVTMYLILEEFHWFIEKRHKFLRQPRPRNYTCYVRNVPLEYRSHEKLAEFFKNCFASDNAVVDARLKVTATNLAKYVKRRDLAMSKLEYALVEEQVKGYSPMHMEGLVGVGGYLVNTIEYYAEEVRRLNKEVKKRMDAMEHRIQEEERRRRAIPQYTYYSTTTNNDNSGSDAVPAANKPLADSTTEVEEDDDEEYDDTSSSTGLGEEERQLIERPTLQRKASLTLMTMGVIGRRTSIGGGSRDIEMGTLKTQQHHRRGSLNGGQGGGMAGAAAGGHHSNHNNHNNNDNKSNRRARGTAAIHTSRSYEGEEGGRNALIIRTSNITNRGGGLNSVQQQQQRNSPLWPGQEIELGEECSVSDHMTSSVLSEIGGRTYNNNNNGQTEHTWSTGMSDHSNHLFGRTVQGVGAVATKGVRFAGVAADKGKNLVGTAANRGKMIGDKVAHRGKQLANTGMAVATTAMSLVKGAQDGEFYSGGFVSFNSLSVTNAARQLVHHASPYDMEVLPAPDPNDIFWANVGRPHQDLLIGNLISVCATCAFCLFWTIPMSFFSSLSNVESVAKDYPGLRNALEVFPSLGPLLEQVAPLLVIFCNAVVLPGALRTLSMFEGPVSGSVVEASTFSKQAAFVIIQTFFVQLISGSFSKEIKTFFKNPGSAFNLLADKLPGQSTYFMQIAFIRTVVYIANENLRVVAIAMAFARTFVGPNLTEKQRQTSYMGIRPLGDPAEFELSFNMSQICVLYFVILLVYQPIAPLTSFVMGFCFRLTRAAYLHQFIYIYPNTRDSGGVIWTGFIQILLAIMLIAEFVVLGLTGLKKAKFATPLMIPLIIITVLFNAYVRQRHFRVTEVLPSKECLKYDLKNGDDFNLDFVKGAYVQEELRYKEVFPEGMSKERLVAFGLKSYEQVMEEEKEKLRLVNDKLKNAMFGGDDDDVNGNGNHDDVTENRPGSIFTKRRPSVKEEDDRWLVTKWFFR